MISIVNHCDPAMAEQIYQLQQAAHRVERDLIAYQDFPKTVQRYNSGG